jgi:tetratricopeptide (TPR) repeat protein
VIIQKLYDLSKGLAIQPKSFNALTDKDVSLDSLGNHIQAIEYYNKSLAMQPNDICALLYVTTYHK